MVSCEQTPLATDLRQVFSQLCPWDAWVCLAPSVLSSGREEGCRSSPLKPQPRTPPQLGCCEASEAAGRSSGTRHSAGTPRRVAVVSWPARGPPPPTSSSSDPRRRDPPGPQPARPEDAELPSRGKVDSFGRSPVPAPSPLPGNFNTIGVPTRPGALGRADGPTRRILPPPGSHRLCR